MNGGYEELRNRFVYHAPVGSKVQIHEQVRAACFELVETLMELVPDSNEREIAIERIEETMFWANAAVARYLVGDEE